MQSGPALPDPGRGEDPARRSAEPGDRVRSGPGDWEPVVTRADWMSEEDWQAWCAALPEEDEPPEEELDPGWEEAGLEEVIAECRQIGEDQARAAANAARLGTTGALAAIAALAGRRGPGQPGSAQVFPGEYPSRAAQFATGMLFDTMPGCPELAAFADAAAGEDDRYDGASDDEVLGALCAWDRVEAHAAARKLAAVAELIRRRPGPGCALAGPAQMPQVWDEFTSNELSYALAQSGWAADAMLGLALDLEVKLPGTRASFRDGILSGDKASMIARATMLLDPDQARAAEALVLDRAGRLTPGGLRAAIIRAVMEVAPDKAKKRREQAAKDARVERWTELSGNAALAGLELPPAEVLAADQRVSWWARQLKQAGLAGSMNELRAQAYLDLLLGRDSRAAASPADGQDGAGVGSVSRVGAGPDGPAGDGSGPLGSAGPEGPRGPNGPQAPDGPAAPAAGPVASPVPAGFVGRVNLTVPLATVLGLADRPGEMAGLGPIDPGLARDLARATAQNPKTTWCVTVTDELGHAIGHGCARSEPKSHSKHRGKRQKPGPPDGPDPPRGVRNRDGPGFAFSAAGEHGPPGGYGTWRLSTGATGQPDLVVALDPIATDECDHRFEAKGHDPGVKLRHLSQIRHATCTAPTCRRPAAQADFEHNIPYEAGGRSCLCNGGPKCRRDHRLKQHPRWKVEQITPAVFRWTTPAGRQYTTEPTRYPI